MSHSLYKCKGGHALDSCPNRRRWENVSTGDDDIQSVASDLGAGNDGGADPVEFSADGVEASNVSAAGVASDGSASNPVPSLIFWRHILLKCLLCPLKFLPLLWMRGLISWMSFSLKMSL